MITLPPTIKPGRSLPELNQAINVWTRQCQQTIQNVSDSITNISTENIPIANATTTGLISFTDWNIFNSKQPAGAYLLDAPTDGTIYGRKNGTWVAAGGSGSVATGNLTEVTSAVLTITGGTNAVVGSGVTLQVQKSSSTSSGYLSSTDWNTFNGKQAGLTFGNVAEVTSSVLTLTGGTGAVVGSGLAVQVKQATTSQAGYLSSTDWNTFNGKLSDAPNNSNVYARQAGAWVVIAAPAILVSFQAPIAGTGPNNFPHGLGVMPTEFWATIVCTTANTGYNLNDEIDCEAAVNTAAIPAWEAQFTVVADATNITVVVNNNGVNFSLVDRANGLLSSMNASAWNIKVYARS